MESLAKTFTRCNERYQHVKVEVGSLSSEGGRDHDLSFHAIAIIRLVDGCSEEEDPIGEEST